MNSFNSNNNDAPKPSKLLFSQESSQSVFKPISGDRVILSGDAVNIFDATQPHFDQAASINAAVSAESIAKMDDATFKSLTNYFKSATAIHSNSTGAPSKQM
jgi:hypothetical protein